MLLRDGGETAAFVADLIPTAAHLPLPWIMGYDLEPLRTLESKRAFLADAVREGWRIVFEHDPGVAMAGGWWQEVEGPVRCCIGERRRR